MIFNHMTQPVHAMSSLWRSTARQSRPMKRRTFSWLLALLFFCGVAGPATAQRPTEPPLQPYGDFLYRRIEGRAVIAGYTGAGGDVVLPDSIEGLPVRVSGGFAQRLVTSVKIPDSVIQIDGGAFSYCLELQKIEVGEGNPAYRSISGVLYSKNQTVLVQCPAGKAGGFTIPDGVTSVGGRAFESCFRLSGITFPSSVTVIENGAFNDCTGLTECPLPSGLTTLGDLVFGNCQALTSLTLPVSLTSVGAFTFQDCKRLTAISLPAGITTIGNNIFQNCTGLASVSLPPNLTLIGERAFQNCLALTSLTLPASLTSIGDHIFEGCKGLTGISLPAGITTIGDSAFQDCTVLNSVFLAPNLTLIGESAFGNCPVLTSLTLPASLTSIGAYAFLNCDGLTTMTIPAGVTKMGNGVFRACRGLLEIVVAAGNPTYTGIGGVMFNKIGSTLIQFPAGKSGTYAVPGGVTSIAGAAFAFSAGLEAVTLPESIRSIGEEAFGGTGLQSIVIPTGVISLGDHILRDCSNLLSVSLPEGLTEIPFAAFFNCVKLTDIRLPDSLVSIGGGAFRRCMALTTINIPSGVTLIHDQFEECSALKEFVVSPENQALSSLDGVLFDKAASKLVQYPGGKAGHYTIPANVITIRQNAFAYSSGLTSVSFPDSVTAIPFGAFQGSTGLTSITIPAGVTTIAEYAFTDCSGLQEIIVDGGNPEYSSLDGVLFNKSRTQLIQYPIGKPGACIVPGGVTGISQFAFARSGKLTALTLPESLGAIGDYAFWGCTGLTGLTLPEKVSYIGNYTFWDCAGLTSLILSAGLEQIGYGAFAGCTGLVDMRIPDLVTKLDRDTFQGCASLARLILPRRLRAIYAGAFSECPALEEVICLGDAPSGMGGATGFTVYYYEGSQGFTSPVWMGYPTVVLIPPKILSITREKGAFSVTISGQTGKSYQLQSSGGAGNGSVWTPVATVGPLVEGRGVLTDPLPPQGRGFYRVAEVYP
ncbi:MAG: leucine-rich repeat domain-containing protein [Verrucomicrobiaceae bacterium]|nr:MAG: leucine-rich repeat domain-containing protein [Verrucomicrobiaceae bacterium]